MEMNIITDRGDFIKITPMEIIINKCYQILDF